MEYKTFHPFRCYMLMFMYKGVHTVFACICLVHLHCYLEKDSIWSRSGHVDPTSSHLLSLPFLKAETLHVTGSCHMQPGPPSNIQTRKTWENIGKVEDDKIP